MTNEQSREVFNQAIATSTDPERIAWLEVAREFFTNAAFRAALSDATFRLTA